MLDSGALVVNGLNVMCEHRFKNRRATAEENDVMTGETFASLA